MEEGGGDIKLAKSRKEAKVKKPRSSRESGNEGKSEERKKSGKTGSESRKKLYRSTKNRMIAGVCGGIAEYLDADPTIVRLVWAVVTVFIIPIGILAYIIAWIIIPEK